MAPALMMTMMGSFPRACTRISEATDDLLILGAFFDLLPIASQSLGLDCRMRRGRHGCLRSEQGWPSHKINMVYTKEKTRRARMTLLEIWYMTSLLLCTDLE